MTRYLLVGLVCLTPLFGQAGGSSAELTGTVTDPAGARVPKAGVVLKNEATGREKHLESDGKGEYRFLQVSPGSYELRVAKAGFKTNVLKEIRLTVGQNADLHVTLELGETSTLVEVSGVTSVVESERTTQANTLEQEFVKNLPINRRDYLSFTLLAPGVVDAVAMADNSDFRVKPTPTSGLSFYGSNGRGNSVTVDGGEANDDGGGVRQTLSQEGVEEFQINRSNYSAELGGASGGVINIVSKTGSNAVHGSAFGFFRHDAMDAGDPFARVLQDNGQIVRVKPPNKRQQFGGSLGGPIKQDSTFLFGAVEGLNRDESNVVSVLTDRSIFRTTRDQEAVLSRLPDAAAAQLRGALTAPASTVQLFEKNNGVTPFSTSDAKFSIRLDHHPSSSNQLFARFNYARTKDANANTHALVGSSRGTDLRLLDTTAIVGWTHTKDPHTINDLKVQFNRYHQQVNSLETFGPEINIAGYGFFNKDIFLPNEVKARHVEIKDTVNLYRGNHHLKFGGTAIVRTNYSDNHTFFGGRFGFGALPGGLVNPALATVSLTALQAFNLGLPQSYQQGFGDGVVEATYPFYAGFFQDKWKIRSNFTVEAGMRYEVDTRKAPLPTDKNNVAPRIAFAWDPFKDGKTTVRGGYGIFYSPIYFQIDYVVNALGEIDGKRQVAQVLTTIQTAGPAAANNIYSTLRRQGVISLPTPTRGIQAADLSQFGITISQTGPRPLFTVLFENSPNYVNPYSQQATLAIERQLTRHTSFTISGIYARTLKITRARDKNLLPAPVDPRLGIRVWRTQDFQNPLIYQFNVYESSARAYYAGLILEFKKRFSNKLSLVGNYTFSKATDEVVDYNSDFQPNDQTNLRAERSLSAFDQRHKVVVYGIVEAPGKIQVTPIFRGNSARPFNLLAGVDVNADRHSSTDRPPGAGRNTGIGPAFYTFDLRLSRTVVLHEKARVELMAEAFNLTNHLNYSSINNTVTGCSQTNNASQVCSSNNPVGVIPGPFNLHGRKDLGPSEFLGFTSAFETRRLQMGVRLTF